jgi:hypothetical protein
LNLHLLAQIARVEVLKNVQMAQNHVQPESHCFSEDNESDSEDARCALDSIEKRLTTLERIVYVMCRDRQSDLKRRTMFDYIEFWLSTTVHQNTCTPREEMIQAAAGLAKGDAMAF